jgi:hypothetical protein
VNKTQGATVGAILAAGLLMRPGGQTTTPVPVPGHAAATKSQGSAKIAGEEGPWIASCRYWSPARKLADSPTAQKTATVDLAVKGEDFDVASTVSAELESSADYGCATAASKLKRPGTPSQSGNDMLRWGIPNSLPVGLKPDIHLIIAAVRDPIHSHLALEFDRDVDALVQAAGDNGYVPSYYWLPWKRQTGQSRADEATGTESLDEDSRREQQPGMIIFKYVPAVPDPKAKEDPGNGYSKVIYVFLVGETPTLGIDGEQLKNAFRYEGQLAENAQNSNPHEPLYKVSFSMSEGNRLDMIGPNSSGSAASMREAIKLGREDIEDLTDKDLTHKDLAHKDLAHKDLAHKDLAHKDLTHKDLTHKTFAVEVAGTTSTELASYLMNESLGSDPAPTYHSFGDEFENGQIKDLLTSAGYNVREAAILVEDSTAFGAANAPVPENSGAANALRDKDDFLRIRFPREISLLRNAHTDDSESREAQSDTVASPFLHLSLKDPGATDSVPQFSPEHTPLSQEAQLMAIGRQLVNDRIKFIVIVSSNVLDQLFLAQFLHRACPDARLVFLGADMLFERETENAPFIGSITITPYSLLGPVSSQGIRGEARIFADSNTEAFYNASSFIFWDGQGRPSLANYRNPLDPSGPLRASLWATAIGRDGYYPLAIVNDCAKMFQTTDCSSEQTPAPGQPTPPPSNSVHSQLSFFGKLLQMVQFSGQHYEGRPYRYPALSWYVLCIVITMLCVVHSFAVSFPNYWSSATRDLAIPQGDKRHLRAMYIHIGSVMLFCMAFVTAYPLFPAFRVIHPNWSTARYSLITIFAAIAAFSLTLRKTWRFLNWHDVSAFIDEGSSTLQKLRIKFDKNLPWFFNRLAFVALGVIVIVWAYICHTEKVEGVPNHVGFFFSYRCLHPGSGVSPVVPILLVLLGWYIWAVFQTLRLRFSTKNRPQLPGQIQGSGPFPIYVSDLDLAQRSGTTDRCLFDNITCLLITRNWFNRLIERYNAWLTPWLFLFYLSVYCLVVFVIRVESLDRILWKSGRWPTWYEWLLSSLFYPLIMIAVAGWLRIVLVWGALRQGLLHRLEQFPIRYAFNRLKGTSWMAMMRQGGLAEQWQDMSRSIESIHQMCNDTNLLENVREPYRSRMRDVKDKLDAEIRALRKGFPPGERHSSDSNLYFEDDPSVPPDKYKELSTFWAEGRIGAPEETKAGPASGQTKTDQSGLDHMYSIEKYFAAFCEALLGGVLLEYWEKTRTGFVASDEIEELPIEAHVLPEVEASKGSRNPLQLHASSVGQEPKFIRVAEEFLAIRYLSLIRAVLVNVRYLMMFVSSVFVLTIVAWNSYPFQPRQWVNEAFTGLMILLGTGIIWVFAQIHRDPILNRITNTKANELGLDFYLRVTMFGAAPVLTWLAYQFPEVGGSILRWIQPSLEVLK